MMHGQKNIKLYVWVYPCCTCKYFSCVFTCTCGSHEHFSLLGNMFVLFTSISK